MTQPTTPPFLATRLAAAASQRTDQERVSLLVQHTVDETWPIIEHEHLKTTLPHWFAAMYAIVHKYGQVAAVIAKNYLERTRPADLGHYQPSIAEPAKAEQVIKSLTWATRGLYSAQPDTVAVRTTVQGVAQKLVQDPARATYMDNFFGDRMTAAWARIPRPGACSFCALLATRGPVYKSQASASFQAHDHCHCTALMIYKGETYTSPEYIQQWLATYKTSTAGKHGAGARNAFRKALGQG